MTSTLFALFVTTPKGIEPLLANELQTLGLANVTPTRAGVKCEGTLTQAYQICLWSRLANRVLLPLATFPAPEAEALYEGVQTIRWDEHLSPQGTLAVEFSSLYSKIDHTHFGALKVKDAIVDQFRTHYGTRPNVSLHHPDLQVRVHIHDDEATVYLDLAGDSLHKRGYRKPGLEAPLKENLAAAMLIRGNWPSIAQTGGGLLDPMCGSGTLLIEGALIVADVAPALLRDYFGFLKWRQHEATIWKTLTKEAQQRKHAGLARLPTIRGYDIESKAVTLALLNAKQAGFAKKIQIECAPLSSLIEGKKQFATPGLIITNPPFGERLGTTTELRHLYGQLGDSLRTHFQGWQALVLAGNVELGKQLAIRAKKIYMLYNGALECKLLQFEITPEWFMQANSPPVKELLTFSSLGESLEKTKTNLAQLPLHHPDQAQMLANRLVKNLKNLKKWLERDQIHCFRLYDADLPEYAVVIDVYERWVHLQEYSPPDTIEVNTAQSRLQDALTIVTEVLQIPAKHLFMKVRQPQRGKQQYQKQNETGHFYEVREGAAVFWVNFTDYLDTGLFLDHRLTRQMIQRLAPGRRFLNLFGYTGTATVMAALGGATSTTTIDLSKTYLAWAQRNLVRNGFTQSCHQLIQSDCFTWLTQTTEDYDLIFLDPPTFSNSKRLNGTLDLQRDHLGLIQAAVRRLTADGILIFSTNYQRFKLDTEELIGQLHLENLTRLTLPTDFARSPKIHQCWKIQKQTKNRI